MQVNGQLCSIIENLKLSQFVKEYCFHFVDIYVLHASVKSTLFDYSRSTRQLCF